MTTVLLLGSKNREIMFYKKEILKFFFLKSIKLKAQSRKLEPGAVCVLILLGHLLPDFFDTVHSSVHKHPLLKSGICGRIISPGLSTAVSASGIRAFCFRLSAFGLLRLLNVHAF